MQSLALLSELEESEDGTCRSCCHGVVTSLSPPRALRRVIDATYMTAVRSDGEHRLGSVGLSDSTVANCGGVDQNGEDEDTSGNKYIISTSYTSMSKAIHL